MKVFNGRTDNRKNLVKRLEELTGQKSRYTFLPRCVYLFEHCTVEKDGSLTVDDSMDQKVISILISERLITGRVEEPEERKTVTKPRKKITVPHENRKTVIEEEEALEPLGLTKLHFLYPMSEQTAKSMRNLLHMFYSRQGLINKATQGEFYIPDSLIERLKQKTTFSSTDELVQFIKTSEEVTGDKIGGIEFSEEYLTLTGFPPTDDRDVVLAFMQFSYFMIRHCMNSEKVLPRVADPTEGNEKYSFRTWLDRMKMVGPEYRESREFLLHFLSGDAAFCTKESADRRQAKTQKEKKERGR